MSLLAPNRYRSHVTGANSERPLSTELSEPMDYSDNEQIQEPAQEPIPTTSKEPSRRSTRKLQSIAFKCRKPSWNETFSEESELQPNNTCDHCKVLYTSVVVCYRILLSLSLCSIIYSLRCTLLIRSPTDNCLKYSFKSFELNVIQLFWWNTTLFQTDILWWK